MLLRQPAAQANQRAWRERGLLRDELGDAARRAVDAEDRLSGHQALLPFRLYFGLNSAKFSPLNIFVALPNFSL